MGNTIPIDKREVERRDCMSRILLHHAEIVNEGEVYIGSLLIHGNRIESIFRHESEDDSWMEKLPTIDQTINCKGLILIPGVIDDQVHFREPGLTHKATIESESKAAVAGGVTSFLEMPNTKPPTINLGELMKKRERAHNTSWANYGFFVGGTNSNAHEVFRIDRSLFAGYKLFLGSSTGNMLIDNPKALDEFFAESPKVIAIHSESEPIITANKQQYMARYGEDPPIACHPLIRSEEACYRCTAEAMERATKWGTHLHILHLSTAREAALLHSPLSFEEKKITAEACIHHLWFSDEDYATKGALIKWNPAIKTKKDREALKEALRSGAIDIIATDHAPHLLSEKEGGALKAASGGPLIQYSLLAVMELVNRKELSLTDMVQKMCHHPARRFGIQQRGFLREGFFADLTLINPHQTTTVGRNGDTILSPCGWSPFEGYTFSHSIYTTIINGEIAYSAGQLQQRPTVEALCFE